MDFWSVWVLTGVSIVLAIATIILVAAEVWRGAPGGVRPALPGADDRARPSRVPHRCEIVGPVDARRGSRENRRVRL